MRIFAWLILVLKVQLTLRGKFKDRVPVYISNEDVAILCDNNVMGHFKPLEKKKAQDNFKVHTSKEEKQLSSVQRTAETSWS